MSNQTWIVVTESKELTSTLAVIGDTSVAALVVGTKELADLAAATAVARVVWMETANGTPAEAFAKAAAEILAADGATLIAGGSSPAACAILGATAVALGATLLSSVSSIDGTSVVQNGLGGRVIETVSYEGPLVVSVVPAEASVSEGSAPVEQNLATPNAVQLSSTESLASSSGVTDAQRVVSVGRGLKQKDDLALIETLAAAANAEVGCSMPVADDLGWVAKERYVGRSGQHISPQLYLAVGISGAPQHLEGIREAKVVAAINSDPEAHIFGAANYGIVGDLYEVVPALTKALAH